MTKNFIRAIHNRTKIRLSFYSKQDSAVLTRLCAPMDFGASKRAKNKDDRYHLWDYESDNANHTLSLLPEQVVKMEFTDIVFDPSEFVAWTPNWIIERNWGIHS
jgi:hypothetical protein